MRTLRITIAADPEAQNTRHLYEGVAVGRAGGEAGRICSVSLCGSQWIDADPVGLTRRQDMAASICPHCLETVAARLAKSQAKSQKARKNGASNDRHG